MPEISSDIQKSIEELKRSLSNRVLAPQEEKEVIEHIGKLRSQFDSEEQGDGSFEAVIKKFIEDNNLDTQKGKSFQGKKKRLESLLKDSFPEEFRKIKTFIEISFDEALVSKIIREDLTLQREVKAIAQEYNAERVEFAYRCWCKVLEKKPISIFSPTSHSGVRHPFEMVRIPAGYFKLQGMKVHVTYPFYISKYPIFFREGVQKDYPIVESYLHTVKMINQFSMEAGLLPRYDTKEKDTLVTRHARSGYRLPTVAEWQHAAHAGEDYVYAGSNNVDDVAVTKDLKNPRRLPANISLTSEKWRVEEDYPSFISIVGTKRANDFGLYDMSGNVAEWCEDSSDLHSWLCKKNQKWDGVCDPNKTQDKWREPRFDRPDRKCVMGGGWYRSEVISKHTYSNNSNIQYKMWVQGNANIAQESCEFTDLEFNLPLQAGFRLVYLPEEG